MSRAVEEWRMELLKEGSSEQKMIDFQNVVSMLEKEHVLNHEEAVSLVSKALNYKPN